MNTVTYTYPHILTNSRTFTRAPSQGPSNPGRETRRAVADGCVRQDAQQAGASGRSPGAPVTANGGYAPRLTNVGVMEEFDVH